MNDVENLKAACKCIEIVTLDEVCRSIPERWSSQYEGTRDKKKIETGKRLFAARKEMTADKAEEIIGNRSWSNLECECCGAVELPFVVRMYRLDSIDVPFVDFCRGCVGIADLFAEAEIGERHG